MGYWDNLLGETERVTLDAIHPNLKDLWVEFRSPNSILYGEAREKELRLAKFKRSTEPTPEELDEMANIITELVGEFIVDWNLKDNEGDELPLPSEDPTSLDKLPRVVVEFIVNKVISTLEAATNPSEATKGRKKSKRSGRG